MKSFLLFLLVCLFNLSAIGQPKSEDLFVFVGKKISVSKVRGTSSPTYDTIEPRSSDKDTLFILKIGYPKYAAVYKIIKPVYGNFTDDTIQFAAFDEFADPDFVKYEHVLLFLKKEKTGRFRYLHQFFDLYQTTNGIWASDYDLKSYSHPRSDEFTVEPEKIPFKEGVYIDISSFDEEYIEEHYPSTYYKIEDDKAIPIYGNYLEDLFKLKKQGVLKARGYF